MLLSQFHICISKVQTLLMALPPINYIISFFLSMGHGVHCVIPHFCIFVTYTQRVTKSRTRIGPWHKLLIRGWLPWAIADERKGGCVLRGGRLKSPKILADIICTWPLIPYSNSLDRRETSPLTVTLFTVTLHLQWHFWHAPNDWFVSKLPLLTVTAWLQWHFGLVLRVSL